MEPMFDFCEALARLMARKRLSRDAWNSNPVQFVEAQYPSAAAQWTEPFLWIQPARGGPVPWQPHQVDLFAEDWFEVH